jgi:signal transduction histidine kinase
LPIANPNDELGHLASIVNGVLDRLEYSFQQLRRFTSDVSHELRTPLAAIRSVGEVGLQRSRSASEYQDTIGSMLEEVARLTQLVDSLLAMSRADAGQVQPVVTVFDVAQVIREAISVIDVLAEEKRQKLVINILAETLIEGDPLLLRQALINVLHNAVKFSPANGHVTITTRCGEDQVEIRIQDSGPGIPVGDRGKVFDRFYRVDSSRARESGGVGLGLSIARWAVQVQMGEIQILDEGDTGATFSITLPMSPVAAATRPTRTT